MRRRRKIRYLIRGRRRRTRNLAKIGGETHFSKSRGGRERRRERQHRNLGSLPSPPLSEIFSAHPYFGQRREARSTVRLCVADLHNSAFGLLVGESGEDCQSRCRNLLIRSLTFRHRPRRHRHTCTSKFSQFQPICVNET